MTAASAFKVGDRARLTGRLWDSFGDDDRPTMRGLEVTITSLYEYGARFQHGGSVWCITDGCYDAELVTEDAEAGVVAALQAQVTVYAAQLEQIRGILGATA